MGELTPFQVVEVSEQCVLIRSRSGWATGKKSVFQICLPTSASPLEPVGGYTWVSSKQQQQTLVSSG